MPEGKLSVYSSFHQKKKEGIYLTPERMQNLLRGEQELRQGEKNHVKEIITCKE
jgi:hypothetical protein